MSQYILILIWIAFFVIIGSGIRMYRTEIIQNKKIMTMKPIWAFILVFPLVIWTANREYIGDTYSYIRMYSELPGSVNGIFSYMQGIEKDKGFYFVSAVIKGIIGDNVNIYLTLAI